MLVREYTEGDLDALRAIHAAQGFDYAFPDLGNPLFLTKLVLTRDSDSSSVGAQPCPERERGNAAPHAPVAGTSEISAADREGNSRIVGAALLRLTAEAYLLLDPGAGTPRERWQWLLALHEAARRDAWLRGLEDVHAWLPPRIAEKFGRRLQRLGWRRDDSWTPYCKKLEGK